jgi:hypothetical protein
MRLPLFPEKRTWFNRALMSEKVPKKRKSRLHRFAKEKIRPKAAPNSNLIMVDYAALNAGFDFPAFSNGMKLG